MRDYRDMAIEGLACRVIMCEMAQGICVVCRWLTLVNQVTGTGNSRNTDVRPAVVVAGLRPNGSR